jgi:TRAP-type uncharacterized transport system substrate-binding protein
MKGLSKALARTVLILLGLQLFGAVSIVSAQPATVYQDRKREANENVVTIIASGITSPYTRFAEDMQNVLDQQNTPGGLRVLPMLGRGGSHNALDVLLLRGVDMGIMEQGDLITARQKDPTVFSAADSRLHYIAKLANSEYQILARKEIKTLKDLEGKKVNFFKMKSSTQIVSEKIFKTLKINVEPVYLDQADANAKLKSGEIAAAARFAGAPHDAFTGFKATDDVHFLSVDPETVSMEDFSKLLDTLSPALLRNDHFPELIPADKPVPTVAGGMILVAYNWPANTERYQRLTNFVNEFFNNIEKFNSPARHPKWKEINIASEVPGWTRFKPAQDWLDNRQKAEKNATAEVRVAFDQFLRGQGAAPISPEQREQLFAQFMQWWNTQKISQR